MARMTLAYNAERTDVLCAQMSGLMRRQSLQHFQAPPDEIRANRKAERHFDKLNDKFCSAHRGVRLFYLILQPAALLLLPDLCNSILLVADNSRQLKDVMMVPSCSVSTLME